MKKIFIDANIYLNFFDSNKSELKKLLNPLLGIKNSLFISSQIVNEVNRNKLSVTQNSLTNSNLFKNLSKIKEINNLHLPEQAEIENMSLEGWNNESKNICKKNENLYKDIENIIHSTLEKVMCSTDKVSQTLNVLFKDAVRASESEIQAGRDRKEVGNPPGKPDDPLGDQVSWEQFKNCSRNSKNIWIITNDRDYYTSFKDKAYLNPFLYDELVKANTNANPSIFCFETLSDGLTHFNKNNSEKIDKLPTGKELRLITKEELSDSEAQRRVPFITLFQNGEQTPMYLPPGFPSPGSYLRHLELLDPYE